MPFGAHTIERPSPCSRSGTGPAGPRGGDRVPAGLPEGTRVPGRRRFCRRRVGKPESRPALLEADRPPGRTGSPGRHGAWVGEGFGRSWHGIRTITGSAGGGKETGRQHKLHTAGQPAALLDDGQRGPRSRTDEVASSPPRPGGLLVLIPPGDLQTSASPPACRWEVGPDRSEDPHREETRGVGPVTGSAGSERLCGRGGRHHFRLKAEGPL
jgi:hypothetical protein